MVCKISEVTINKCSKKIEQRKNYLSNISFTPKNKLDIRVSCLKIT